MNKIIIIMDEIGDLEVDVETEDREQAIEMLKSALLSLCEIQEQEQKSIQNLN